MKRQVNPFDYAGDICKALPGGILLTTAQDNVRGQGLYEHCGFEKLGVAKNGEFQYVLRFPLKK